ncbi:MAG: sigma-54-dependent Fis family transcriptional regulator [Candidatus Dadabacteria bacterium]|nr:sigma-54-dependent Fis family transcriptional regulator [Candidatus Dadabacteria bacterium]MYA48624.1 sigma-54-dependent Fis family transcriptional regulator [Candidatus Dadabacteria bacterium]MYG82770.1 sigma-54-dependent Fis family transcriptional regulator [Candidatus Dadabacteria bacterium]MYK48748.1 sigma-54-dependent Fis family transcriptional regulator [Candidatus Dadabacteria bacterium]
MKDRILVADDEEDIRWILETSLKKSGFEVECAENGEDAVRKAHEEAYSLILLDINMPDMNGFEVLSQLRDRGIDSPIIFITAQNTVSNAIDSMQLGAYDYLTKPFDLEEVKLFAERAIKSYNAGRKIRLSEDAEENISFEEIVGSSPDMLNVYKIIGRTASKNITVLISGESGTGKELIARAIHYNSPRRKKRLVSVNISAIPKELMESELFGYEKGAFTGAMALKKGRFEEADGGTLHIDEIGELSTDLQSKLLRAIEEKQIYRLGSEKPVPVDPRIIASTNKNLRDAVAEGSFREDLFYRLNVISINLPPLRERKEDISELLKHFLKKYSAELGTEKKVFSSEAEQLLINHNWPGNVRELENTIKRLLVLSPDSIISAKETKDAMDSQTSYEETETTERKTEELVRVMVENSDFSLQNVHEQVIGRVEKQLIQTILAKTDGNMKQAAAILGINRNTLSKKINDLGIEKS